MNRSSWVLVVLLAGCSSQPTVVAGDNGALPDVESPADDGGTGPEEALDGLVLPDGQDGQDGEVALRDDLPFDEPSADADVLATDSPAADVDGLMEVEVPALDAPPDVAIDACTPECGEAECGDDGCGGTCGECTGGRVCTNGTCECMERAYRACCDNAVCWFDSCGTEGLWIVDCPKGCEASRCVDCTSQCAGKACGEDGCGGECGQCPAGQCEGLDWTQPGACVNGQCMEGGALQSCDDGVVCTRDSCDPRLGCTHKVRADGAVCEAGRCEALTWSRPRTCASGQCTGGGETEGCEDGNFCTDDACNSEAGCVFTPNTIGCDDGDPCTAKDACANGVCVGTDLRNCDDGNACTTDSCTEGGCSSAVQGGYCLITGLGCVDGGQMNAADPCQVCTPSTSTTTWSPLGEGASCGTEQVCHLGDCCTRQCGDRTCGDDGCGGTCGTCSGGQECDAGACVNPTCGGTACPALAGYNVACNARAHCEYSNPDTTGWKQYDVWIYIAPGSFTMGSPASESGHSTNEEPNHTVTFSKGYLIAKYELTVSQYEGCTAASPGTCTSPSAADWNLCSGLGVNTSGNGRSSHPQNGLTWDQAGAACTWLGGRRASEAEWEYAASGPTHRKYPWGDSPEPSCSNDTASFEPGSSCGCGIGGTMPVGSKTAGASWSGALDMAGNVWEWTEDNTHTSYNGAPSDGSAWMSSTNPARILRSGSFGSGASYLRSSVRISATPSVRYAIHGARCVRDLPVTCGGITCPTMGGYKATCNAQAHCEYANPDTTGWKQHDVWIYIAPGSFPMGAPSIEAGHGADEEPVHMVTFAYGYFLAKHEVTVGQYEACNAATPGKCTAPSTADWDGDGWGANASANDRSSHPQNGLDWDQSRSACEWMGGRLPSEAEWEYAATGPVHRKYPWGDSPEPDCTRVVFDQDGSWGRPWGCESCTTGGCSGTSPVGSKAAGASWSGAHDMSGNVWEWVEDNWHESYTGAPTGGTAWLTPASSSRVVRGGGFYYDASYQRASYRKLGPPSTRTANHGARCVRDLPVTCGGDSCPFVGGYKASCNAQQHCEYANPDTTGWKKHDVWIYIAPGSFTMGSPAGESGHTSSEDPNHVVTFAKGYLFGKYEVTVAQYEACEAASPGTCSEPSVADWPGTNGLNTSANGRSAHPQNGLAWDQAGAVCSWLGGRRPSEAEWEYAATGPTHRKFPWGDAPEPTCVNGTANFSETGTQAGDGCGSGGTMVSGTKAAGVSWSGALDMAGNAWEWVEDLYHSTYSGAPGDGSAWLSSTSSARVVRGASFAYSASFLRSSYRQDDGPLHRSARIGARCLRSLP